MNRWLVSITAAAAAAGAFAVESQNIVGFVEAAEVAADTYYMIGVPFEEVGGDGTISFDKLIKLNGIQAYEDGDANCAQIQVREGNGYAMYYYITDAWDANDEELGHDAWSPDGYECTAADIQALGNGFWFKAPVAAEGATISTIGQVSDANEISVSFPGGGSYNIVANPFPTDISFADVTTTGVTALEDGDANCAQIQVREGNGYAMYYYITDAWDANDEERGYDAWSPDGYECVGTSVAKGASFWIKSNDAGTGTITFSK